MTIATDGLTAESAGLLAQLPTEELDRRVAALLEEEAKRAGYMMRVYFPDEGPYRRELYPKHLSFFDAGKTHRERLFLAANRIGKTIVGAYECTVHLTGLYPPWWTGRRFPRAIKAWAAGDTSKTVREIIQPKLVGDYGRIGTGMIPAHTLAHISHKPGSPGAVDTVWVKHVTGAMSTVSLLSYEQRREAFQGTAREVVWLDEEPDQDITTECLLRTMDTPEMPGGGLLILTFTPLRGMTPLILTFLQNEVPETRPISSDGSDGTEPVRKPEYRRG